MGFFSADCRCGHPLLGSGATNSINAWMTDGVAIHPDGRIVHGRYDGYGSLTPTGEVNEAGDPALQAAGWESGITVWHKACWLAAGSPTDNQGESPRSEDQGWFFDEGDHDMPEPRHTT